MTSLAAPECLHIHELTEGEPARISWGKAAGAEGYILERQFNETFEQASAGRTWANIEAAQKQWDEIEQGALSWGQLELLPALGLAWDNIDYAALSWDEWEAEDLTWDDWALQPLRFEIFRGSGTKEMGNTWTEWEEDNGDWSTAETSSQPWDQWESVEQHRAMTDEMPIGAKMAIYRIDSYDAGGAESTFLTSSLTPITPIFFREDAAQWQAKAGEHYWLFIEGSGIRDPDRVPLALRYQAGILNLDDFLSPVPGKQTNRGIYPSAHIRIVDNILGEIRFLCTKPLTPGKNWGGRITIACFTAKKTGAAEIKLF